MNIIPEQDIKVEDLYWIEKLYFNYQNAGMRN